MNIVQLELGEVFKVWKKSNESIISLLKAGLVDDAINVLNDINEEMDKVKEDK